MDLCWQNETVAKEGKRYAPIVFRDVCTRYMYVNFLAKKSDAAHTLEFFFLQ